MRWYRPIPGDCSVENPLICEASNFEQYNYWGKGPYRVENYFFQGKPIDNWPGDVFLTTNKEKNDGTPDDVLQNSYMIPIFSQRLVDTLIDTEIKGFQFLPISVLNYYKDPVGLFYIANCTTEVDAFDYERSTYRRFPDDHINPEARGKITCSKFVLVEEKTVGYDVFRLKGQNRVYFVSERITKLFNEFHFTGYSFDRIATS